MFRQPSERAVVLRPPPDHYDGNPLVAPHFAHLPHLTEALLLYTRHGTPWQRRRWEGLATEVKFATRDLYTIHALRYPGRCGLYIAGTEQECLRRDRDRMMILVFTLYIDQVQQWRSVHDGLTAILRRFGLDGRHGVCIRYYAKSRDPLRYGRPSSLDAVRRLLDAGATSSIGRSSNNQAASLALTLIDPPLTSPPTQRAPSTVSPLTRSYQAPLFSPLSTSIDDSMTADLLLLWDGVGNLDMPPPFRDAD